MHWGITHMFSIWRDTHMPTHGYAYQCKIEMCMFLWNQNRTKTTYDYHNSGTCYFVFYYLNVIQKSMIMYTIFHENILSHWHALPYWAISWSARCCVHFTPEWLCWPGRSPCAATQWSSLNLHWSFTATWENGIYPGISRFINLKSLMPVFQYLKEARIFYGF